MADPTKIQSLDRTVHVSNSGIDIERMFSFEPYSAHPAVLKALMGSVTREGPGHPWVRTPPARDPWILNCYCNDAVVTFADKRVMASSPDIEKGKDTLLKKLEDTKEKPADGTAGAIVRAHYRPLITAWDNPFEPEKQWDWLDPTFTPGVRQMPWPEGLYIDFNGLPAAVPDTVGFPFAVPVDDISVRRILVPEIPWVAINGAKGCVNSKTWPKAGSGAAGLFHPCPPRTLRFEGVKVINQVDSEGERWYELEIRFTKITEYAENIHSASGDDNPGWVTWNEIFTRPSIWGFKGKTSWFEVYKGEAVPAWNAPVSIDYPFIAKFAGRMYSTCDFDVLFDLNQPPANP